MFWLLAASMIWAFAFGLVKHYLAGLDPWWVASVRLCLAALVFLPWTIACAPAGGARRARAMLLGMVQFGAMYVFYLAAFASLAAWQVALWTVLTPAYVAVLGAWRAHRPPARPLLAALVAIAGAVLAEGRLPQGPSLHGVLLVQASNLCFAAGQLAYRPLAAGVRAASRRRAAEAGLLGWMYLGAVGLVLLGLLCFGQRQLPAASGGAAGALLYLGVVSTGVAFWFWNKGAARTDAGRLAVANNLKVPLAILAAGAVFQEAAPYLRAAAGLAVILVALRWSAAPDDPGPTERGDPGPFGPGSRSAAGS